MLLAFSKNLFVLLKFFKEYYLIIFNTWNKNQYISILNSTTIIVVCVVVAVVSSILFYFNFSSYFFIITNSFYYE